MRLRPETVLVADAPAAAVRVFLVPLGQQAAASIPPDDQLMLADHFLGLDDEGGSDDDGGGGGRTSSVASGARPSSPPTAAQAAKALLASAARSPGVLDVRAVGAPAADRRVAGGRTYVRYEYEVTRCADGGGSGDDDASSGCTTRATRTTAVSATVTSVSQWRTNTERERMAAMGVDREVKVLWIAAASLPSSAVAADARAIDELRRIAASFRVP